MNNTENRDGKHTGMRKEFKIITSFRDCHKDNAQDQKYVICKNAQFRSNEMQ